MKPLVSIVTPSYNQAAYLEETIRSVLEQDYEPLEYVVVDDGSTDGSVEIAERYADRLTLIQQENSGQPGAINRGFAQTRGELIGYLNSDDTLLPGAIDAMVAELEREPRALLVYGDAPYTDEHSERTGYLRARDFDVAAMQRTCDNPSCSRRRSGRRVWERFGPFDEGVLLLRLRVLRPLPARPCAPARDAVVDIPHPRGGEVDRRRRLAACPRPRAPRREAADSRGPLERASARRGVRVRRARPTAGPAIFAAGPPSSSEPRLAALAFVDGEELLTGRSRAAAPRAQTLVNVLYVAGVPHSGTTLLARVLGEVDGLFPAGEVYALSERIENGDRCGCGARLGECPFWGSVLRSAFPEGDALRRLRTERRWIQGRVLPSLTLGRDRERLSDYRDALARLYRGIAAGSGCRVVVDSSKSPTFAYIVDRTPGVELHGVHLERDPRATSYSWSVDPHYHRTRGPAFGARWTFWNLELEALALRRLFVRLRFEDFLRSPEAETRRILGLVGARDESLPFVNGHAARLPSHHMIEGHRSRFDTGVIDIRANTAWQRHLSAQRELTTTLLASPLQLLYRYPLTGRGSQ